MLLDLREFPYLCVRGNFVDLNMSSEVHLSFENGMYINLLKLGHVEYKSKHNKSVSRCFILDNMFISSIKAFLVYAFHGRDVFK